MNIDSPNSPSAEDPILNSMGIEEPNDPISAEEASNPTENVKPLSKKGRALSKLKKSSQGNVEIPDRPRLSCNDINDANLTNIYASALPDILFKDGCPYYPRLQAYYNRRQNFNKNVVDMRYGSSFSISINNSNNTHFFERGYLKFRTPAVTLNDKNPYGIHGTIRKCREFGFNIFESLRYTISGDDMLTGELNCDLMIMNLYCDITNVLPIVNNMLGNVPSQIQPHGVGQTLEAWEYSVPIKNCLSVNIPRFFPLASLINRTLRIEGVLRNQARLFIVEDSRILDQEQPVVYLKPEWLHNYSNTIRDFKFVYKYVNVTDDEAITIQSGGQARNICLEVFDPTPLYQPFRIDGCSDFNYVDLGIRTDVHHIFFGVKNVTNAAEHSCFTILRPIMVQAPNLVTGALGRMDFTPGNNRILPFSKVKFDYNDTYIEIEDSFAFNQESVFETCLSYPHHLPGLCLKSYDAGIFSLHPSLGDVHLPNGNSTKITMGFIPSQTVIDLHNQNRTVTVDGKVIRIPKPQYTTWVDVVSVKLFRIEQSAIALFRGTGFINC